MTDESFHTPPSPSVLLLAGAASPDRPSMNRYATELLAALRAAPGASRVLSLEQPLERRYLSRMVDHPQAQRIDSAWFRYVAYPRSLRGREAGVYHILDHAYAHLIRSLRPDRTVVTCHDVIPLLAAEGVIPVRVPATVAYTFRARIGWLARARRVIAISAATRDTLERYTRVQADRIVVIPYGVNGAFRPLPDAAGPRRAAGIHAGARVLLHVSTQGRYKNTPVLLRAFAELRARIADAVLVRLGAPFYPDEAALAANLGIADAIRYVGVTHDDGALAEWYNAADVLVFPSLWEGFGWPPLEAMACGTPVVASRIPAIIEVVGDAGLLVSAEDPSAVAQATRRVLTDPALAESLRAKGLERARAFTWARAAEQTLAVYDAVVA